MSVRPYHHGNLPAAMLDAVAAIVREEGVGAVSLREAARRAGVSHAAPAHHFRDKRGLLTRFAMRGYELLTAQMDETVATSDDQDGRGLLRKLGLTYVRFALEHREYFEVMYRHELLDTADPAFQTARDGSGVSLMAGTARAQAAGWAPAADPIIAALAAWSLVHGFASLWLSDTLADRLADADPVALTDALASVMLGKDG